MSLKYMTWAFTLPLPPHPLVVLLAIADNTNDEGVCWPKISTIADKASQSERSVQRWLSTFERMGLIARFQRNADAGGQIANEIRVNMTMSPSDVRAALERMKPANDDAEAAAESGEGDTVAPHGDSVSPPAEGAARAASVTPPVTLESPPSKEEPPSEPISPKAPLPANDDRPADDGFERFQAAYPIPVTDMPKARGAWSAMSAEERERAIAGALSYRALIARSPRRAVKDAHRWLKGLGWQGFSGPHAAVPGATAAQVFVIAGSPQGDAWEVYRTTFGKMNPTPRPGPDGRTRGWFVPSEWPPFGQGFSPRDQGVFVVHKSRQWWAWLERLRECDAAWDGRIGVRPAPLGASMPPGTQGRYFPSEWPPPKGGRRADDGDAFEASF